MANRPPQILPRITGPADLKGLSKGEFDLLAEEVRDLIIETVRTNGGHLAPSLGVVELTLALHAVFDSPRDKIVWDVGHQCYAHKILTGRADQFSSIRQVGGLSGFCRRVESHHDAFGAGHASTSISSALGIAAARDTLGERFHVAAVIGDGGLSGGLAFEGLDNAGGSGRDFIVILNDNNMSISPTVGALSRHLTEIITHPIFERAKKEVWDLTEKLPKVTNTVRQTVRRVEESLKGLLTPGLFFENLGFRYLGPIDGHKTPELISVLKKVKKMRGPILVHVLTQKGRGLADAENNPRKFHGVPPVKPESGKVEKPSGRLSYTQVFGQTLVQLATVRPELTAVSAAMCDGTGLTEFSERFPDRFYDVGIAEGHAVTFSAGMATQGLRPVIAIYSTFLQRAFDHIIHDVALQGLPVILALDRAGLVGDDGATHHGVFDLAYLSAVPNMVIAAPRDGRELRALMVTAASHKDGPFAIRYPRSAVPDEEALSGLPDPIPVGSWETLSEGADGALLAVGTMVPVAQEAARSLKDAGIELGVVNARFIKPLDTEKLEALFASRLLVTLEEGTLNGGLGSLVAGELTRRGWGRHAGQRLLRFGLPDAFVEHGSRDELLRMVGLTPGQIADQIRLALQGSRPAQGRTAYGVPLSSGS